VFGSARRPAGQGYRPRRSGSGRASACSSPCPGLGGLPRLRPGGPGALALIRHAQAAGLTLEHRQLLDIRDGGEPPCVHVTGLITRRLAEVEARLAELARARDQLAALAERAAAQDPADCRGYCSMIAGGAGIAGCP
jgi:hypothetical protein